MKMKQILAVLSGTAASAAGTAAYGTLIGGIGSGILKVSYDAVAYSIPDGFKVGAVGGAVVGAVFGLAASTYAMRPETEATIREIVDFTIPALANPLLNGGVGYGILYAANQQTMGLFQTLSALVTGWGVAYAAQKVIECYKNPCSLFSRSATTVAHLAPLQEPLDDTDTLRIAM